MCVTLNRNVGGFLFQEDVDCDADPPILFCIRITHVEVLHAEQKSQGPQTQENKFGV